MLGAQGLKPVSPKLIPARYLASIPGHLISLALIVGTAAVAVWFELWWLLIPALIPLTWMLPSLLLTPRRVRALGYLDGEQELTTAKGILFREVSTTPYGRVQSVEIHEGPIERRFGLSTLSFTTASTGADSSIPGLPRAEAERLKELLTRRGIERMQSL